MREPIVNRGQATTDIVTRTNPSNAEIIGVEGIQIHRLVEAQQPRKRTRVSRSNLRRSAAVVSITTHGRHSRNDVAGDDGLGTNVVRVQTIASNVVYLRSLNRTQTNLTLIQNLARRRPNTVVTTGDVAASRRTAQTSHIRVVGRSIQPAVSALSRL